MQDCSYSQSSKAFEEVQALSSPNLIKPILCNTLDIIAKDCLIILDVCFNEEDKKLMVNNFLENLREFLERIGGEHIENGTLSDCGVNQENEKERMIKFEIANIEVDTVDLSDNNLEVNTDDTDHQIINENINDTDANAFNDYIELRYFKSDVELLQQEDNVRLVYINDAKSTAVTLKCCLLSTAVLIVLHILSCHV